ncbi:Uncharacterised protein [Phocoenobacter uteri]|uniref:Uncharacterized protein n=1 Tax=Phocoenobacter uteri TaxID=146806 RepID=A0A379C9N1_9PAST|nr:Uncharacterised protein [Phocoenobacter uteri]
MRTVLIDLLGVSGIISICVGIYLIYGSAITCITAGILLLLYALVAGSKK